MPVIDICGIRPLFHYPPGISLSPLGHGHPIDAHSPILWIIMPITDVKLEPTRDQNLSTRVDKKLPECSPNHQTGGYRSSELQLIIAKVAKVKVQS